MTAVNALKMTDELKNNYLERRKHLAREMVNLQQDIEDLEKRIAGQKDSFFSAAVLPEWKAHLEKLAREISECSTYANTVSVFLGENMKLLSEVDIAGNIFARETSNTSYDDFWLETDKFLAGERSPKKEDLDWCV